MQRLTNVAPASVSAKHTGSFTPVPKPSKPFSLKGLTINELHQHLNYAGYLCEMKVSTQLFFALNNAPVKGAIIQGVTGSGKTFLPQKLAEIANCKFFSYQCQLHTDENDLIQKLIPFEETKSGIKLADNILLNAIKSSQEELTVVCIDEYDKSRPSTDTVMLEFLQRGGIHWNNINYQGKLENMIIFICCNKEREISEFIQRRMCVIEFGKLSPEIVGQALLREYSDNPYMPYGYAIYKALFNAAIPKNVSLQEIIQLIEAVRHAGGEVSWGNLIFQFISKHQELHRDIMKHLESALNFTGQTLSIEVDNKPVTFTPTELSVQKKIEEAVGKISEAAVFSKTSLKSPPAKAIGSVKLKKFNWDITPKEEEEILSENKGMVYLMEAGTYHRISAAFARFSFDLSNPTPSEIWVTKKQPSGETITVLKANVEVTPSHEVFMTTDKPFDIRNDQHQAVLTVMFDGSSAAKGELCLEYNFDSPLNDLKIITTSMATNLNLTIVSMAQSEVHMEHHTNMQVRITKNKVEAIINTQALSAKTIATKMLSLLNALNPKVEEKK